LLCEVGGTLRTDQDLAAVAEFQFDPAISPGDVSPAAGARTETIATEVAGGVIFDDLRGVYLVERDLPFLPKAAEADGDLRSPQIRNQAHGDKPDIDRYEQDGQKEQVPA